jgi:hypothetical protein
MRNAEVATARVLSSRNPVELAEDKRSQKGRSLTVKGRPAGLSDPEKAVITVTCQRFIDEVLKPMSTAARIQASVAE